MYQKLAMVTYNQIARRPECQWIQSDLINFDCKLTVQVCGGIYTLPKFMKNREGQWMHYTGLLSMSRDSIKVAVKADPLHERSIAGLVNFQNKFIFAIGGDVKGKSVERYQISFD